MSITRRLLVEAGPPLLLTVFGLLVLWSGLRGGFFFDDFPNLVNDQNWKLTSLNWKEVQRASFNGIASKIGRPLAMASFGLNYYFTGMDPFWFKLTGLSLHLFNGVLVYWLCRRIFAIAYIRQSNRAQTNELGDLAAWLAALIWVIHPLQVSSALYIVQRMEVGAHTFILLALLAYLRGRTWSPRSAPADEESSQAANMPQAPLKYKLRSASTCLRFSLGWILLAGALTLLGLGFKESAIIAPAYAFLIELALLRFLNSDGRRLRWLSTAYAAGITLGLTFFLWKILPGTLQPSTYEFRDFTLGERLLSQGPVLFLYLKQILLPMPTNLSFYYDNFPISNSLLQPPFTLVAWLLLATMAVAGFITRDRYPLITLGVGWFFAAHTLTSNVWPLELAFEHRNYFALLGIVIVLAQLLLLAAKHLRSQVRMTLIFALVTFLALLSSLQARTWGDPAILASSLSERNPTSQRAQYELGKLYLAASNSSVDSPYWSRATAQMEKASALPGGNGLAEQALIVMASSTGQEVPPELWDRFGEKLTRNALGPESINSLHSVQACRIEQRCELDDDQLFNTFLAVLKRNPASPTAHSLYANFALNVLGDPKLATRMLREATALSDEGPQYQLNLAKLLTASNTELEERDALLAKVQAANTDGRFDTELANIERARETVADREESHEAPSIN